MYSESISLILRSPIASWGMLNRLIQPSKSCDKLVIGGGIGGRRYWEGQYWEGGGIGRGGIGREAVLGGRRYWEGGGIGRGGIGRAVLGGRRYWEGRLSTVIGPGMRSPQQSPYGGSGLPYQTMTPKTACTLLWWILKLLRQPSKSCKVFTINPVKDERCWSWEPWSF